MSTKRRLHQRITFPGTVEAMIPSIGIGFQGTIHNISRSGIGIIAPKAVGKGSIVTLGIRYLGLDRALFDTRVEGKVAFALTGNRYSILGIAFHEVINSSYQTLFHLIADLESKNRPS